MALNRLLATFTAYNQAVWPVQIALLVLALALVLLCLRGGAASGRMVYGGLAVLWAWCGAVFFLVFYARYAAVRPVAYLIGAAFVLQAALFGRAAVVERGSTVALRADRGGLLGATLIGYALVVYPLFASALGQHYPAQPTFGVPCPVTVFTFGMLLLMNERVPGHLLGIPFVFAVLGILLVLRVGMLEDIGLIVAGLLASPLILAHNRRLRSAAASTPATPVGETPAPPEGIRRLH